MGRLLVSFAVTPYGGVWIEILQFQRFLRQYYVTPYGGVWIEIVPADQWVHRTGGHALWGRVD